MMKWTHRKVVARLAKVEQELEQLRAVIDEHTSLPWSEYAPWVFRGEGVAITARESQLTNEWALMKLMAMPLAERVRFFRKYRI